MKMKWTGCFIIFGNVFVMLLCYINILLNCWLFLVLSKNMFNVHEIPATCNPKTNVVRAQVSPMFISYPWQVILNMLWTGKLTWSSWACFTCNPLIMLFPHKLSHTWQSPILGRFEYGTTSAGIKCVLGLLVRWAHENWGDLCGDNMCFGSSCHGELMNIGATCAGTTCVLGVLVTGRSWTLGRVVERWSCTGTN